MSDSRGAITPAGDVTRARRSSAASRASPVLRAVRVVRGWGALVWLGLAWLAGPVPGHGARGVTGQPTGELWWWHLAAAALVLWVALDAVRAGEVGLRIDGTFARAWTGGRRWHAVVVTGWLALAVLALAQAMEGTASPAASWGDVVTFLAAATIAGLAPRWSVGGEVVPRLAAGGLVLALFAVATFAGAADGLGEAFGYYRTKQEVLAPVAAHNVLAGFLLVAAPAVALASVRRPRWWWPVLGVLGLAVAATLSRAAVVAGVVAVAVAWFVVRDHTLARRVGVVVLLGALGIGAALAAVGAQNPDQDRPESVVARSELWGAALDAVGERPATGVGLDGFRAYTEDSGLAAPHEHAHNLPLHAAATLGIPGLLATAAVWIGLVVGAWGLLDRDRRALVLVALAGLGSLAMVDELALRPATVGLLALLTTAVAAPRDPSRIPTAPV